MLKPSLVRPMLFVASLCFAGYAGLSHAEPAGVAQENQEQAGDGTKPDWVEPWSEWCKSGEARN